MKKITPFFAILRSNITVDVFSSIFADLSAGWFLALFNSPNVFSLTKRLIVSILCLYLSILCRHIYERNKRLSRKSWNWHTTFDYCRRPHPLCEPQNNWSRHSSSQKQIIVSTLFSLPSKIYTLSLIVKVLCGAMRCRPAQDTTPWREAVRLGNGESLAGSKCYGHILDQKKPPLLFWVADWVLVFTCHTSGDYTILWGKMQEKTITSRRLLFKQPDQFFNLDTEWV